MTDKITFINHATVLIELNGARIITDPVYAFSVSYFLPRLKKPGIPFNELPPIDYIAVSHNHYDHLNLRTLRRLRQRGDSTVFLPLGNGSYGRRAGFTQVREMQWWETEGNDSFRVTCVPAKHFSGRKPWDRNKSLYGGFVFESKGKAVYFAGDTALDGFFAEMSRRFSLDVALLPIGAYKPHDWFKNIHLNPRSALEAFQQCKARSLVPIHWGTFKISDEPMAEPPALLRQEAEKKGISDRVHILDNGESLQF